MQLCDAIEKRIEGLLTKNNITLYSLALKSGLSCSTISSIRHGRSKHPKLSTILHICEGFNMELKDFFDDELFKDVQDD